MILIICPYIENSLDGFYQRVYEIDSAFRDFPRIYLSISNRIENWSIRELRDGLYTIEIHVSFINSNFFKSFIQNSISVIYCHSIYNYIHIRDLFQEKHDLPDLILDFHGVVPEEVRYEGDQERSNLFSTVEKEAINASKVLIFVSNAMRKFVSEKYDLKEKIVLEIPTGFTCSLDSSSDFTNKYYSYTFEKKVVYAGGTQRWQLVEKVIQLVNEVKTRSISFKIYTPSPRYFQRNIIDKAVVIKTASRSEVIEELKASHFSLILREAHLLNRVSSPTKLSEAISYGVVPVFDYVDIGDSLELGIQYVTLDDFFNAKLPSKTKYREMVEINHRIRSNQLQSAEVNVSELRSIIIQLKIKEGNLSGMEDFIKSSRRTFILNEILHGCCFKPLRLLRLIRYSIKSLGVSP